MPKDNYIIDNQFVYLSRLQQFQPFRPVLVQRPQGGSLELAGKYWNDWHDTFTLQPFLTCSVLSNEIALDPDVKDWNILKTEISKLISHLNDMKIPFLLSWTGGSGIHLEIFFTKNIQIPDDIANNITKYRIDVGRTTRVFLANWLLDQAGVKADVIKLDYSKIRWATESKGSMLRMFGSPRQNGGYKTAITEIPDERPKPDTLPLVFPENLETWDISFLQDELLGAIQEKIDKSRPADIDTFPGWLMQQLSQAKVEGRIKYASDKCGHCTGYQAALKGGIPEGHRDAVATGIINALRFWKRTPQEQTEEIISRWCTTTTPPLDFRGRHIDTKIKSIYKKARMDKCTPCHFFIEAGLCSSSSCSVIRKWSMTT